MSYASRFGVILVIVSSFYLYAHGQVPHRQWKYEDGLVISWDPISKDATAKQIEISNEAGQVVTTLNVLGPVRDARRVSIYDVSARRNEIAIAAVYESKEGNRQVRPTAALLLFDLSGRLLSVFALEPSHQIALLAVDDESNIWTLTNHADINVDPSTVPMVVKYTAKGEVAKELLTRTMFPFHASDMRQNTVIGGPAMGYEAGVVWFWLPGSTDFVTISTSDNKITRTKTLLPQRAGRNVTPVSVWRESSGTLVAQVGENDGQGNRVPAHYRWSPDAAWTRFEPDNCIGGMLIGVGDKRLMYVLHSGERTDLCSLQSAQ